MRKDLLDFYLDAKDAVLRAGFAFEIDWQEDLKFTDVSERAFLREAGWVIFSSGMREAVIRQKFGSLSRAFEGWRSARRIVAQRRRCRVRALAAFNHPGKIDAILTLASRVASVGFAEVKRNIEREGVEYFQTFPYLGPATSYHLAKNIGLDVVKPDRHLVRLASSTGYATPDALCRDLGDLSGDKLSVVDVVLWRYSAEDLAQ